MIDKEIRTSLGAEFLDTLKGLALVNGTVVRYWASDVASGFVVRNDGTFARPWSYLTAALSGNKTTFSVEHFNDEPTHLYARAVLWRLGAPNQETA